MYCVAMGEQYYFNTRTGRVERGKQSGWQDRMGPYASAGEARKAYEIARERNVRADEAEKKWEEAWDDQNE